jgi:hypothetical protein
VKINFLAIKENLNMGSYRIWIHDINKIINENFDKKEFCSKIVYDIRNIENDCNVIILSKSLYRVASDVRRLHPDKKIGAINVDCDYYNPDIDFVIVGSIEEYVSLSKYDNVFIVELIENKFENIKRKEHVDRDEYVIGYHGHHPHLFKFFPFLQKAIEKLNEESNIKLKVIIGDKNFVWKNGKPNIDNIEVLYYEDIDVIKEIQEFDVGVVPNVSDLRIFENFKPISEFKNLEIGLNSTDYFLRFKNKTNPGRAYVLYQLGIPVIHDLSPSSFSFMQMTNKVSCAHDFESWYKELKAMMDSKKREEHSIEFYEVFKNHFNNKTRMLRFLENLKSITLEK